MEQKIQEMKALTLKMEELIKIPTDKSNFELTLSLLKEYCKLLIETKKYLNG